MFFLGNFIFFYFFSKHIQAQLRRHDAHARTLRATDRDLIIRPHAPADPRAPLQDRHLLATRMRGVRGGVERGILGAVVGLPRRTEEHRQRRKRNLEPVPIPHSSAELAQHLVHLKVGTLALLSLRRVQVRARRAVLRVRLSIERHAQVNHAHVDDRRCDALELGIHTSSPSRISNVAPAAVNYSPSSEKRSATFSRAVPGCAVHTTARLAESAVK